MTDLEPMKVQNPTQALELLAKDAGALQSYREITQNAVQAIQAAGREGDVLWDVDWVSVEAAVGADDLPIYRLSCTDNGEGMSPDEQLKYINQLFVSGRDQATDKNFGIGAKVTAGAKNPAGVEYRSWKGGVGSRVVFERDDVGNYGLRRFEVDERVDAWSPLPKAAKPLVLDEDGTVVVLHGVTGEEDTVLAPTASASGGMKWLAKYLNQRYFAFPKGIRVRARELPAERGNWPTSRPTTEGRAGSLRTVTGMRDWLDANAASDLGDLPAAGVTHLADGAHVHWWVIDPEANSDVHWTRGHSAALFQSEIYDALDGQGHRVRLQAFGVIFASRRIAVYVEPAGDVTATIARDSLRLGGETLPWERWGSAFREDLPATIVEVERRVREAASEADHSKAIRDRLRSYQEMFKITSWRPNEAGTDRAWGESPSGTGNASPSKDGSTSGRTGRRGGSGSTTRRDYLSVLDDDGVAATRTSPKRDIPDVTWVRFSESGQPPDRAAEYVRDRNTIFANSEFRVFTDMAARLADDYPGFTEDPSDTIREIVHEWYGQVLVEAVIRSWNFEHERSWQNADYDKLVSPEALTMAILPFSFLHGRLRSVAGSLLGRAQSTTTESPD